jgi:hypothetical protein
LSRLTKSKKEKNKKKTNAGSPLQAFIFLSMCLVLFSGMHRTNQHAVSSTAGCSFFFSFSPQEEMAKEICLPKRLFLRPETATWNMRQTKKVGGMEFKEGA